MENTPTGIKFSLSRRILDQNQNEFQILNNLCGHDRMGNKTVSRYCLFKLCRNSTGTNSSQTSRFFLKRHKQFGTKKVFTKFSGMQNRKNPTFWIQNIVFLFWCLYYRYQARAEEERQKYDAEMASYRQASLGGLGEN